MSELDKRQFSLLGTATGVIVTICIVVVSYLIALRGGRSRSGWVSLERCAQI